jgi:hypothetical protein
LLIREELGILDRLWAALTKDVCAYETRHSCLGNRDNQ